MKGYVINSKFEETLLLPVIVNSNNVENADALTIAKSSSVSFENDGLVTFKGQGSWVLLDFKKEIFGGLRLLTRSAEGYKRLHIRFGESITEAMTDLGVKNAGNDHAPRDIIADVTGLSDLTYGQTGFRFAYIEALDQGKINFKSIYAVSRMPIFENESIITTPDSELNKILETAIRTLKLCCQGGYIWDGIKRDRLVWSGDLNQELITAYHAFGDIENIPACIDLMRETASPDCWINNIPSYSAWWVINLCDYYALSKNKEFFNKNISFAESIIHKLNNCIDQNGNMDFSLSYTSMPFYFDWPTHETDDAKIGTASILIYMAKKFIATQKNTDCLEIIEKLDRYLSAPTVFKQIKAFQVLAGAERNGVAEFLEKDGAKGFSTFMSYYILTAYIMSGGKNALSLIKEYFGGMLSRGATTFWEDFDVEWMKDSGRIDCFPEKGQKDIHGDFGRFCYQNFRHSLCHGWASGVYSFIYENYDKLF